MAVGLSGAPPTLHPVAGIRLGTAAAGIRAGDRPDLAVFEICEGAESAALFTRNTFCAAPVIVARRHLDAARPRYLLINAGNANAGTGTGGILDAEACCAALAGLVGSSQERVLPFSTGVIGEPLPVDRLRAALPEACRNLDAGGWAAAARAIMTTDTVPKGVSRRVSLGGHTVTVTGVAKGAGMIRPDMATMLAFIATDAGIAPALLRRCLADAVETSFHCITVDGDTSTNDACVLIATGRSAAPALTSERDPRYARLAGEIAAVCETLAQAIVRDAEGATKFITLEVGEGASREECRMVAFAVAHSPLVKTAFFAADPNWGRILAAVGRAGVPGLDVTGVSIHLDEVCVVRGGARAPEYSEAQGQAVMRREAIKVRILLGRGEHLARIWTCDLSHEYVRINAEYRS